MGRTHNSSNAQASVLSPHRFLACYYSLSRKSFTGDGHRMWSSKYQHVACHCYALPRKNSNKEGTHHGPKTLWKLEALAKQRSLLVQGAGSGVKGVRKLSRALMQRVRKVVHLLVDKVDHPAGVNLGRMGQRGQERIPKDGHNIVVQDPAETGTTT